jgi:DNA modification methylase
MKPQWEIIEGDCLDVLPTLPAESIHCVVTSPPYWGLRDYDVDEQLGLESTPEEYVAKLVGVFSEVRRVLRPDGTLWLNLGDSYAAGGRGGGGSYMAERKDGSWQRQAIANGYRSAPPGLKPKDLVGIPWRVAFALQADGWYLRSDIIWSKPNPMPESVRDRPTKAHEYVFLMAKSGKYHYDADAIKESVTGNAHHRGSGVNPKATPGKNEQSGDRRRSGFNKRWKVKQNASFSASVTGVVERRNRRTVWTIPTKPFPDAHFATFPPALVIPCIDAGCPEGGVVLDPFAGAGTTGVVAADRGCRFIGIDINPEYCEMARERINEATKQQRLSLP